MRRNWFCVRVGLAAGVLLAVPTGCERGKERTAGKSGAATPRAVEPSVAKPEYDFAAGLEEQFPDVVQFMRHFMETALAGDYGNYRRLVSRAADPESRSRFEKVLNSLARLALESIEEVQLSDVPRAYRLLATAELRPEVRESLRRRNNNRIAILVLEEEGEYRMMLAPPELQPLPAEVATSGPAPSTVPSYPWQRDGDY